VSGPEFFQTGMGRKFYEHDVPKMIEATNRLAAAIEEQNKLNTPKNEYEIVYKETYRSNTRSVRVFAHSKDEARNDFYKANNFEVYETEVRLVQLGG
jgi:hypothetical protein